MASLTLSSITKKQIVAITGLMLVLFIMAHLAGNFWIFTGPAAFNAYATGFNKFRPWFTYVEYGLALVFVVHIWMTANLVIENIQARGGISRYAVDRAVGHRSLATRVMPFSGIYLLAFVVWHIFDFTFIDKTGARSIISGQSYELYGVVVNAFLNPVHSFLYIVAMCALGLHLAHGVESSLQSMGYHPPWFSKIIMASRMFAVMIAIGYSSIPLYILYFWRLPS